MNSDVTILIVDDFELSRITLSSALADLGFGKVEQAEGGAEAIALMQKKALEKAPFDLVICDWVMPDVTGIDVLKFCRGDQTYKTTPFVMLTAEADQSSIVSAFRAGVTEYWNKPIAPDVMEKKLIKLIEKMEKSKAA